MRYLFSPKSLPVIVGLLGLFVVIVLGTLACLLFALQLPAESEIISTAAATATHPSVSLPTASVPTTTPGPPVAQKVVFAAQEPIKGFSDCDVFGFKGIVMAGNGDRLQGVQIVVWDDQAGLLALTITNAEGNYLIEIEDELAQRRLWVQVYQDDLPVSRPAFVETQLDCQNGFQVYQIDWRMIGDQ